MSFFRITRKIEIDAAHRVPDHASKCRHIHGHRYVIEATLEGCLAEQGEERGMVMDFGFLKDVMMESVHKACDHAMILWVDDPQFDQINAVGGKIYYVGNTSTVENLARRWFFMIRAGVTMHNLTMHNPAAQLVRIRVYETPNCWVDYPYADPL